MELIFHIGTAKTGTTAIQGFLDINAKTLAQNNIWYCESLGRPNNIKASLYARDAYNQNGEFYSFHHRDGFYLNDIKTPEIHNKFLRDVRQKFHQEVEVAKRHGIKKFIVSNEHCQQRLSSIHMIRRLVDLFDGLFEEIEILLFLRPQVDLLVSRLSNRGRSGAIRPGDLNIGQDILFYNYWRLYQMWSSMFHYRIKVVPYNSVGNIIEWIKSYLGVSNEQFVYQERLNGAIDYRAASLAYNMALSEAIGDVPNPNPEFLVNELPVEEKIAISRQEAEEIQSRFDGSNAELCESCRNISLQDLTPDLSKYPERGNFQDIFRTIHFQPFLRPVVDLFQVEIWIAKVETKCVEAEWEIERGDITAAIELIEKGEQHLSNARQISVGKQLDTIRGLEQRIKNIRHRIGV